MSTYVRSHDDISGISAYTPRDRDERGICASTSEPNASITPYLEPMMKWGLVSEPETVSYTAARKFIHHRNTSIIVFFEKVAAFRKETPDYREREPITAFMSDASLDSIFLSNSSEWEFLTFLEPQDSSKKLALLPPRDALMSELYEKWSVTQQARAAYRKRIEELKKDAGLDGISMNPSSEREFWIFLESQGFFRKGTLFLLDNGNLRTVWKNERGDQIGLQFLGNGTIQYVMFKRRDPRAENVSRVAGRDTLAGVRRQILALDLGGLLSS